MSLARPDPPVVVVTGASAGVGRAVVRRFARDKARIALIARGADGLEAARYEARAEGVEDGGDSDELVRLLAARLEEVWREPGAGIWESRGPPRHHVYSKVMCWVAFRRAAGWLEESDPQLSRHYRELAEQVHVEVLERGFDAERQAFVRAYDDPVLDAAALRIPLVGFLPADDPRITGTVEAIERELCEDGLVLRYRPEETDDGLRGREGAFVAASFWLAEVYHLQGREPEARALFESLVRRTNDLGLLAEQISPADGRLLGNFPQGLSHLSLVHAAERLGCFRERRAG